MPIVLVADDNRLCRELIRDLLESPDCRVLEACNGAEALAEAERARPDLILLDLEMPVCDGFSALLGLRKTLELSTIPVIAVTARVMSQDLDRIREAGFDSCVTKPIIKGVLRSEVERLLNHASNVCPTEGGQ